MRVRPLSLADLAARRGAAARDADLLESGWEPDGATLADAPHLDDWSETVYPGTALPALYGRVSGHPLLLPGPCLTSPILARGEGWIRTEGRFYTLGTPRALPPPSAVEELVQSWAGHDPDAAGSVPDVIIVIETAPAPEPSPAAPSEPERATSANPDGCPGPIYGPNGFVGW